MCGSNKLKQETRDILLKSKNEKINNILIWKCENCHEEFIDDSSMKKFYSQVKRQKKRRVLAV